MGNMCYGINKCYILYWIFNVIELILAMVFFGSGFELYDYKK